ncbi:MAG TPA: Hpt domain-containing protein [Puia sp.]|nr:Hpt domain-containing protein [Puia sp.]
MSSHVGNNAFIFSDEIDVQSMNDLYGNDYVYVEEVFDTVLKEYSILTDNVISSYSSGNLHALKAAVHKIKPIFGFVGLVDIQQMCQQFELVCQSAPSPDSLSNDYTQLKHKLISSRTLIEEERKKLALFNSQRS